MSRVAPLVRTLGAAAAAAVALISTACAECRSFADCEGEGLVACVDGACVEVEDDLGPSCEGPSDCGETGAWACSDGHCAQRPQCQQLSAGFRYQALCTTAGTVTGTDIVAATDVCAPRLTGSSPLQIAVTLDTLPVEGGLLVDDVGSGGTCFPGTWSALDSTMSLPVCTIGGDTCDVVLRSAQKEGAPCLLASPAPCPEGETCQALTAVPGAGVCR